MNCAIHNEIAAVAFCRTCGKPLCTNCTRDVRGVIYCEACLAGRDNECPTPENLGMQRPGGHGEKVERPREVRAALERGLAAIGKGQLALIHLVLEPVNR